MAFFLLKEGTEQQEILAAPCKEESHEQFLFETDLNQIVEPAACY